MAEREVDVAVIGAGSGGAYALSRIRRHTDDWLLINGGPTGTTCARVGCMPSKAMIQIGDDLEAVYNLSQDIATRAMLVDSRGAMSQVRRLRDFFTARATEKTVGQAGDKFLEGYAEFLDPRTLKVGDDIIRVRRGTVIATGSSPVVPRDWQERFGDRIVTSDTVFELDELPYGMAVVGLGVIGLELGQAIYRIHSRVVGVDMQETIGGLSDPAVARAAIDILNREFPIWLGEEAELSDFGGKIMIRCGLREEIVDKILVSMGRRPNLAGLGLERLGVELDAKGMPPLDRTTMQVGNLPVFMAGDVTGDRPVLHEAADEGRIAGENVASGTIRAYRRKPPMGVVFCAPNIGYAGATWPEVKDHAVVGEYDLANSGRAIAMEAAHGLFRVYGDPATGRLLGAAMVGPRVEHITHRIADWIQQGLTVWDALRLPFYHPVIEEALQNALYDLADKLDHRPDGIPELAPA